MKKKPQTTTPDSDRSSSQPSKGSVKESAPADSGRSAEEEAKRITLERCKFFLEGLIDLPAEETMTLFQEATEGFLERPQKQAEEVKLAAQRRTERQLDLLLTASPFTWEHPVQVLPKPRAKFGDLLRAGQKKLAATQGPERTHLLNVLTKIHRAFKIDERARIRREKKVSRDLQRKIRKIKKWDLNR